MTLWHKGSKYEHPSKQHLQSLKILTTVQEWDINMKYVFWFQYSILFKQEHGELVRSILFRIFLKVPPSAMINRGGVSVFLAFYWGLQKRSRSSCGLIWPWTPSSSNQSVVFLLSPRWRHLDGSVGQEWSRRIRNHRHWFTGRHGQSLEMASDHILIHPLLPCSAAVMRCHCVSVLQVGREAGATVDAGRSPAGCSLGRHQSQRRHRRLQLPGRSHPPLGPGVGEADQVHGCWTR